MSQTYKFIAKTQAGILLKPLFETYIGLTNSIVLFINQTGISTYILNPSKQILIQTILSAAKFDKYVCNDQQIRITMMADEFYTHIKSIKKNNILSLFIEKSNPNQFGIAIDIHGEHANSNISRIKIIDVYDMVSLDAPFSYQHVYNINAKDLQRSIKEVAKMNNTITVYGYKTYMGLKVEKDNIIVKEYCFNIVNERIQPTNEEKSNAYVKTIDSSLLCDISKMLTITKTVNVCLTAGLPIKLEIDTGSILHSDIFIKTTDLYVI